MHELLHNGEPRGKACREISAAGLRDNPLQAQRPRSAWQLARAELAKAVESLSSAQSASTSPDLDDPLDEEADATRATGFNEVHDGLISESDSTPLDRIAGRMCRECSSPLPSHRPQAPGDYQST